LLALANRRQIDEEDLVEAAASRELRRKMLHLVRRRSDEDRRRALLQPREERAEHADLPRIAADAEALLDLVDPQDERRDRGDGAQAFAERVLRRRAREDRREVEAH